MGENELSAMFLGAGKTSDVTTNISDNVVGVCNLVLHTGVRTQRTAACHPGDNFQGIVSIPPKIYKCVCIINLLSAFLFVFFLLANNIR